MSFGSSFLHALEVNGNKFYFHSLTLELYNSPDECPSPEREQELLASYRRKAGENCGIVMGCMFLTTRCVRNCGYCFLQDVHQGDMTTAEIDAGLELIGIGPADLLLYGGEPFLRPDLILHVIHRVKSTGARINLSAATGGVPVDPSLARCLASEGTFIIVSIDGPPAVNNRARPLINGENSFEKAEEAFHVFREAGCRVGISVTVTKKNIETIKEDFQWLMEYFEPDDMGLNPWLHPLKGGRANPMQATGPGILETVVSCMEIAIDRGMYIEQLARRVRPFVRRTPRLKDCACAGGRLVQVPGGTAGTCDCMTVCGDHGVDIKDTDDIKDLLTRFRDLSPVNFPGCITCPALALCGGGCRYDAFHASGVLNGSRPERCSFERDFLRWMIERSVEYGRESLIPAGGFDTGAMPMPIGTMIGEKQRVDT